ncbi:hypothetical protein, partial [Mesorhizobium sp. M7A.F.Ca.CA.001.04.2.1]|uniref:hypothetical protein n=1 Tax=Mesorhizobium sp. M7A.F.Ca.CA.001.04.2.1 TaxID=2496715 RepID=UPI0019D10AB8
KKPRHRRRPPLQSLTEMWIVGDAHHVSSDDQSMPVRVNVCARRPLESTWGEFDHGTQFG